MIHQNGIMELLFEMIGKSLDEQSFSWTMEDLSLRQSVNTPIRNKTLHFLAHFLWYNITVKRHTEKRKIFALFCTFFLICFYHQKALLNGALLLFPEKELIQCRESSCIHVLTLDVRILSKLESYTVRSMFLCIQNTQGQQQAEDTQVNGGGWEEYILSRIRYAYSVRQKESMKRLLL